MIKIKPKYAENIIVCVKKNKSYKWYVTDKEIWFLDLRKLITAYKERGYDIHNSEDFSERFEIDIVDINNASIFLDKVSEFEVSCEDLKRMLIKLEYNYITEMMPSLFVNFDEKELISFYPEPASYENYVPDNWSGKYEKFLVKIPDKYKYWIVNGIELFKEEK